MKRALIIDDERLARNELRKLLAAHPEIEIAGEASNATEGIEKIESINPDLIFLDIDPIRLADALNRFSVDEKGDLASDADAYSNKSMLTENDQVFVKDGERCWFVKLSDIRLFESVGNYARVFFGSNKPLILKSLNALEERLEEKTFFRANRKHIVNLRMIEKVEPYFNGGLLLEIKGGEKVEVSRRQAVRFKEMMSL